MTWSTKMLARVKGRRAVPARSAKAMMGQGAGRVRRVYATRIKPHLSGKKSAAAGLLFDLFMRGEWRADGQRFEIPKSMTDRGFRGRFFLDNYEREERQLVVEYLPRDAAVLELGACLGVVSCITNSRLEQPSRHLVVEAHPRLIPTIERNRERNGSEFVVENALVSRTSEGTFFLHHLVVGGSAQRETGSEITVPVATVEELELKYGIAFNALVMDIEGGELDFLQENPDFLRRLDFVVIEVHDFIIGTERVNTCWSLLRAAGLERMATADASSVWGRPD